MNATTTASRFSIDIEPAKSAGKNRKSRKGKARPATHADNLRRWATSGVVLTLALSALLNGYANSLHSLSPAAGWAMGLVVPVIVLIVGKVAGILFHRRQKPLAYAMGAVGSGLLLLSVWHCSTSISLLTGSPIFLAMPMAVAIDAGLIGCELAVLTA
jgi:hypothetical protein